MKHKSAYRKADRERKTKAGWIKLPYVFTSAHAYTRHIKTFQEIRAYESDIQDSREDDIHLKVRKARSRRNLDQWTLDKMQTRTYKRSWKDFYKVKRQHQIKE